MERIVVNRRDGDLTLRTGAAASGYRRVDSPLVLGESGPRVPLGASL